MRPRLYPDLCFLFVSSGLQLLEMDCCCQPSAEDQQPVCVCVFLHLSVCVFLHLLHLFVCNINVLRQLSPSMFLSDSDIYAVIS